jgi:hypothetical protein
VTIADVSGEIFNTCSELQGSGLRVKFTGCLDMETAPSLERYLGGLDRALDTETIREIEFDVDGLYLMSSSSVSHLAVWVKRLKGQSPACRVRFKTNPNLAWQRRTLDSIRRIADRVVTID